MLWLLRDVVRGFRRWAWLLDCPHCRPSPKLLALRRARKICFALLILRWGLVVTGTLFPEP